MFKPPVGFIMNGFRDTVKLSGGSVWSDVAKRRLSGIAGGTGPADRTGHGTAHPKTVRADGPFRRMRDDSGSCRHLTGQSLGKKTFRRGPNQGLRLNPGPVS